MRSYNIIIVNCYFSLEKICCKNDTTNIFNFSKRKTTRHLHCGVVPLSICIYFTDTFSDYVLNLRSLSKCECDYDVAGFCDSLDLFCVVCGPPPVVLWYSDERTLMRRNIDMAGPLRFFVYGLFRCREMSLAVRDSICQPTNVNLMLYYVCYILSVSIKRKKFNFVLFLFMVLESLSLLDKDLWFRTSYSNLSRREPCYWVQNDTGAVQLQ